MDLPDDAIESFRKRAEIVRSIRRFFDERGYLAAETPLLAATPIPEAHLELFRTELLEPDSSAGTMPRREYFLLPSPEYYLKQLLAAGVGNLYEITRSFRNAESRGDLHNPEFTMLEYYTVDADSDRSLVLTMELLRVLGEEATPLVMTMQEAWDRWAGIDLAATMSGVERDNRHALAREIEERRLSLRVDETESWEDLFQRVFLTHVEPRLPRDQPVFLTHYPAAIPTLARRVPDTPWADRWELYLAGVEVANCFGEETDPKRILSFMQEQDRQRRRHRETQHPWDEKYLQPSHVLPRCSGVALGVDRLVMYLLRRETIHRVISFSVFE
jgi:elongation factor P--(R)-beta-lysine ligase